MSELSDRVKNGPPLRLGEQVAFTAFGSRQVGEVVKLTDLYVHLRWTARSSGKTRVRQIRLSWIS